jgi:hypothetical protein
MISATSFREGGVISPAVLRNEHKYEPLQSLAQLPRIPKRRSSQNSYSTTLSE